MKVLATTIFLIVLVGQGAAVRQCNTKSAGTLLRSISTIASQQQSDCSSPTPGNKLLCYVHNSLPVPEAASTEKCSLMFATNTSMSANERNMLLKNIDQYRAMLTNDCDLGKGVLPQVSNLRKVKYSCSLEILSKFNCNAINPNNWLSDHLTFRARTASNADPKKHTGLFQRIAPFAPAIQVDPNSQYITGGMSDFMRWFMYDDVSQVGCYSQSCPDGRDYLSCQTDHDATLPLTAPLYKPGQRCQTDSDCTVPGWPYCDTYYGMCDYKTKVARAADRFNGVCEDVAGYYIRYNPQDCGTYATGSSIGNDERAIMERGVNQFRRLLNNVCPLALGAPKQISNYRKVKYSCELENEAVFDCANANINNWNSDASTFRQYGRANNGPNGRLNIFLNHDAWKTNIYIKPQDQTFDSRMTADNAARLRMMLDPAVTEFGCFIKVCGDYEFMACKTGQPIVVPYTQSLYTPGARCSADSDCTLPGYGTCDTYSGMCEASQPDSDINVPTVQVPKSQAFTVLIESPDGICSGTLISERHVLTAAHCMIPDGKCLPIQDFDAQPQDFTVFALGNCRSLPNKPCPSNLTEVKQFNVTELAVLEEYFEKCETADLAILTLAIPPGQEKLTHAKFDPRIPKPRFGKYSVSGWGDDPINPENAGTRLSSADLNAFPCRHPEYDHFCVDEIKTDACKGDSGAGLFKDETILGVVSYGSDCRALFQLELQHLENPEMRQSARNGVFISVNPHMDFICNMIETKDCEVTRDSKINERTMFLSSD